MVEPILYLRLKKRAVAKDGQILTIRDLCYLTPEHLGKVVGHIPVCTIKPVYGRVLVIDVFTIMQLIHNHRPEFDLRHVGPNQIIVDIVGNTQKARLLSVLLISILLFLGSGLAIMNFHADVSMHEVHERIYYLITGEKTKKPLILQIPYSIGIGVGMILFFNHLFKHRFNEEPSPVELEVFLYQESIDQYIINDEKQRLENHHDPPK